MQLMTPRVSH